jgi:hypothetical protein
MLSYELLQNSVDSKSFHLEEYTALRSEIVHHAEVNASIEREAIFGSVAVYAWGLTQSHSIFIQTGQFSVLCLALIFFLPCILTYISWLRARKHGDRIGLLGQYISYLEEDFKEGIRVKLQSTNNAIERKAVYGWEHFLAESRPDPDDPARADPIGKTTDERWKLYLILSFACSSLLTFMKWAPGSMYFNDMPF